MQVRCIKAFGTTEPGEIVDGLPDGALIDPEHWEIVEDEKPPPPPPPPAAPILSAAAITPKEGM